MPFGGVGVSCMYRLKSVGLSTEPCGTPLGKFLVLDETPLYCTNDCLPDK